jgi:flagellar protein FlaG
MLSDTLIAGARSMAVGGPSIGKSAPAAGLDNGPAKTAPRVIAPKANDIQFDEAQAHQNLKQAMAMLNRQMASSKQALGFSYDDSMKRPVITVRNTSTGEVVRQIPTEEVIRVAHRMDELKGILFNKAS